MVTVKFYIKEYLKKQPNNFGFVAGGTLEREISSFTAYKPSYIARCLRQMAQKGELSTEYTKLGTGREYVSYQLNNHYVGTSRY